MRGDSLRDFYAKTLAVLGLGLLAGAGAIVDYWPVSGEWPTVPAVAALRQEHVMAAPAVPSELRAPVVVRASYQSQSQSQSESQSRRVSSRAFATSFRSIQFAEPVVAVDPTPPIPEFDLTRVEAAWSPMTPSIEFALEAPPAPPIPMGVSPAPRPLLTGAVSALRKTRTSIREAFRSVAGTFRRVSPFFDTTTTTPSFR